MRVYAKDPAQATVGDPENQDFYLLRLSPDELITGQGGQIGRAHV